jgi:MFS family permease
MASGFFMLRWGYRKPMLVGSIVSGICLFLFALEFKQVNILGTEISSLVLVSAVALIMGLGTGVANPASNNACLDLMPHRASTMQGIRGLFRQSGWAIATGAIVLLTIPFIFFIPDRISQPLEGK